MKFKILAFICLALAPNVALTRNIQSEATSLAENSLSASVNNVQGSGTDAESSQRTQIPATQTPTQPKQTSNATRSSDLHDGLSNHQDSDFNQNDIKAVISKNKAHDSTLLQETEQKDIKVPSKAPFETDFSPSLNYHKESNAKIAKEVQGQKPLQTKNNKVTKLTRIQVTSSPEKINQKDIQKKMFANKYLKRRSQGLKRIQQAQNYARKKFDGINQYQDLLNRILDEQNNMQKSSELTQKNGPQKRRNSNRVIQQNTLLRHSKATFGAKKVTDQPTQSHESSQRDQNRSKNHENSSHKNLNKKQKQMVPATIQFDN